MAATITIPVSDELWTELQEKARQQKTTPEALVSHCLSGLFPLPAANGPAPGSFFRKWAGAVDSEITDVAENHDEYIGQALYDELTGRTGDGDVR